MAISQRGNREYHYATDRLNGRVQTVYFGHGPLAVDRAQRWAHERAEFRERRAEIKARGRDRRRALADEAEALDDRASRVLDLAGLVMEAAGFHRHKRGEWRRRRVVNEPGKKVAVVDRGELERDLMASLAPMQAGQPGAEEKARRFIELVRRDHPEGLPSFLAAFGGDPAIRAEDDLIARFAGASPLAQEATRERLRLFRDEITGPGLVTGLERVLVEEVGIAWLAHHEASGRASRMADHAHTDVKVAEFHQRLADRAHRRFLSVVKTLNEVRRKALPALQVNIAGERVGVMVSGSVAGNERPRRDGPASIDPSF